MCGLMATGVQELEPTLAVIGAGAIELAGARAPQISDSRGTGGTTEFMGHLQAATVRSVPKFLGSQHTPTWYDIRATKFCKVTTSDR